MEIKEEITSRPLDMAKEVKEMVIELNTQTGRSQFTTNLINGQLKAIQLANESPMDIHIFSMNGYTLFLEKNRTGSHYFPLKATALNRNAEKYNFVADDYFLNEQLGIIIDGQPNTQMKIVLKYL